VPTTIDEVIADLAARQAELSEFIDRHMGDLADEATARRLVRVLAIHGENATRLGRLMVAQKAFSEGWSEGIAAVITRALEDIEAEREREQDDGKRELPKHAVE
jgi:hypothetical protein